MIQSYIDTFLEICNNFCKFAKFLIFIKNPAKNVQKQKCANYKIIQICKNICNIFKKNVFKEYWKWAIILLRDTSAQNQCKIVLLIKVFQRAIYIKMSKSNYRKYVCLKDRFRLVKGKIRHSSSMPKDLDSCSRIKSPALSLEGNCLLEMSKKIQQPQTNTCWVISEKRPGVGFQGPSPLYFSSPSSP